LCGRQRGIQIQDSQLTSIGRDDAERTDTDLSIDADALRVVLNKTCSSRENCDPDPEVDSGQKKCGPAWSPLAASLDQGGGALRELLQHSPVGDRERPEGESILALLTALWERKLETPYQSVKGPTGDWGLGTGD